MHSLVNYGQGNSANRLKSLGFLNVNASMYWTSSSLAGWPNNAWFINMMSGEIFYNSKNGPSYVWPVRGN